MIVHNSNIIVSGEAILSAENCGKPLAGRDSAPNPAGGAYSASPDPLAGGLLLPPQEPHPTSIFGFSPPPPKKKKEEENSWAHP